MIGAAGPVAGAHRVDFLRGVRVLELGDGVAGSGAGTLLWSLGADVTTVIEPSSAHRRGHPSVEVDGRPASLLSIVLDRGKDVRVLRGTEAVEDLLAGGEVGGAPFDVVVFDRVAGCRETLAPLHDLAVYAEFVATHNRQAWITISAFGLTGARAGDIATEITVAAAGGMLASVRDERTGQPLKLAGSQSLLNTGQVGALAACHALDLAASGAPVHLDLSAVEATIATGPVLEIGCVSLNTGSLGGARRYGAPASFYECTDGLIRISAMEDHQWRGVVEAMGSPDWVTRFDTVQSRIDGADDVDALVGAWTRTRTKEDAESRLQANGVPATALYSPAELLDSPQLAFREAFERLPVVGGRDARVVGMPFRVVARADDARGGGPPRRSLRGLRLLEAAHVLAAPLAGAILGALGVEVTKLEDTRRMDMYRRRGPYIDGEEGMERSAYFALVNHSKRSVAFDVDADRARLDALLEDADVVLENQGRKRASSLGVAASSVVAEHADLLAVSSSGFGHDGPRAAYRAYAYNLQTSCGLVHLTRNEGGEPAEIDIAWADLITGFALATIIAAWAVGPAGNAGVGIDFAMADLIVAHFNEFVAAASLDPDSDAGVDRANELTPYAPHGVYRTADGWLALAVERDDEFAALSSVLGERSLQDPALATAEARLARRRELDRGVSRAVQARFAGQVASELRTAGVAAEEVTTVAGLLRSPHLESRGFFTTVEHPDWGRRSLVGIPWRPVGAAALGLGAPPRFAPLDGDVD